MKDFSKIEGMFKEWLAFTNLTLDDLSDNELFALKNTHVVRSTLFDLIMVPVIDNILYFRELELR